MTSPLLDSLACCPALAWLPQRESPYGVRVPCPYLGLAGRFRRVVTLPDDIDPNAVSARYGDGVLHVSIARKQAAQPRRIPVH